MTLDEAIVIYLKQDCAPTLGGYVQITLSL